MNAANFTLELSELSCNPPKTPLSLRINDSFHKNGRKEGKRKNLITFAFTKFWAAKLFPIIIPMQDIGLASMIMVGLRMRVKLGR